ncbi:HAD family hydrolase [Dongshaea marina]|uniref:HAD family hydrolase n=1 Tax=Dongshaea marina TaxID=2047966 RepID=UPI00131EFCAF|nr:HAD family phosphatase [Dongshaea marina]
MAGLNQVKGIFFDLDGTLIESSRFYYRAWSTALEHYDIDLEYSVYLGLFNSGYESHKVAQLLHRHYHVSCPLEELKARRKECLELMLESAVPEALPGADALLRTLSEGSCPIALVTANSRFLVNRVLEHYEWASLFDCVVSMEDASRNKPAPDLYQLTCQRLGLAPQSCVAVEDSPAGLMSAQQAGLQLLWVHGDKKTPPLESLVALDDLDAVGQWLGSCA